MASLDPLARREFLQDLMETVAEEQVNIVLSSHLIGDLERVCDYLIVLADSRCRSPAGRRSCWPPTTCCPARAATKTGCRPGCGSSPAATDRQSTLLVRADGPVLDPAWTVSEIGLEDLVLAYVSTGR